MPPTSISSDYLQKGGRNRARVWQQARLFVVLKKRKCNLPRHTRGRERSSNEKNFSSGARRIPRTPSKRREEKHRPPSLQTCGGKKKDPSCPTQQYRCASFSSLDEGEKEGGGREGGAARPCKTVRREDDGKRARRVATAASEGFDHDAERVAWPFFYTSEGEREKSCLSRRSRSSAEGRAGGGRRVQMILYFLPEGEEGARQVRAPRIWKEKRR